MRRDQIKKGSWIVSRIISADTNVFVEYSLAIPQILKHRSGYPNLVAYLDAAKSLNNLEICDIVHEEFSLPTNKISPIEWAVDRVTNRYFLNSTPRLKKNFLKKCTERFDDLINGCPRIPRYEQKLSEVDAMYQGIWNDSSQSANRENWFKIKSRHRLRLKNSPPSGNDLGILAALMHRQEESKRKVQFITNDNDFLSFDERIREKLGIVVTPKYAFDPGNWNARRNL